jgi:hypothetical protein
MLLQTQCRGPCAYPDSFGFNAELLKCSLARSFVWGAQPAFKPEWRWIGRPWLRLSPELLHCRKTQVRDRIHEKTVSFLTGTPFVFREQLLKRG